MLVLLRTIDAVFLLVTFKNSNNLTQRLWIAIDAGDFERGGTGEDGTVGWGG
jgi:hypothetical protein